MLIRASIEDEERRELKRLALERRTTMTALIASVLRSFIAESRSGGGRSSKSKP